MAYSSITKPEDHFETITYTGDGNSTQNITANFQVDWSWIKHRSTTAAHTLQDSVRGFDLTKKLSSNENDPENDSSGATWENYGGVTAVSETNFTVSLGSNTPYQTNASGVNYVAWNWKAGGTAPAVTYSVKVVSDSGNKYRFDDYGTSAVTLDLQEGGTYTFDQSDSSNSGHPLRFSTTSDGSHGGGSEYTTGVTTTGTPGSAGAKTVITVAASAPTLYYYCTQHSGMGGQANTNSTFGSSNFAGATQSTVSVNSAAGFSIINWAGSSSDSVQTIGHGLGATPHWILSKNRGSGSSITAWINYHHKIDASAPEDYTVYLNNQDQRVDNPVFGDTAPTSTVFSFNTGTDNQNYISYCFTEKKGFSKFGSYTGTGNADGPFLYTGFKPAWIMIRRVVGNTGSWVIHDNKRDPHNIVAATLDADNNTAEASTSRGDFLSNGFKNRSTTGFNNESGHSYIYMAFAENPFVANDSGTSVPVTAR
jgi:hypothetical protein